VVLGGLLVVVLLLGGGLAAWAFVGPGPIDPDPTTTPPANPPATEGTLDNQIVFVSDRDGVRSLYVMDADGGNVTRLTGSDIDTATAPAVAPDGTRVAFVSEGDIYVINADGSGLRRLTEGGDAVSPTWAPDSTRLAFAQSNHMYTLAVDDDDSTPNQLPGPPGAYRDLHWCPQEGDERLLFVQNDDIFVITASGEDRANLTRSDGVSDIEPAWSPDCERIAFASNRGEDGDWDIYVMQSDGGALSLLVDDTDRPRLDRSPTWSPDDQRIAFRSFRSGNQEIYVMQADGSDPIRLTENEAEDTAPVWSP
jgi:Tol biopolymer transport system component